VPYVWGITGIFFTREEQGPAPAHWADLWRPEWHNQLMLLNDSREVFAIALLALDYPVNDESPDHIHEAFLKLRELLPNIRLFRSDGVIGLMADGDVSAGMAWSGDMVKARQHNPALSFVFPKEGFVISVDSFAIPRHAPHKKNALRFIDFMLRPDIAAKASLQTGYPVANRDARKKLPADFRNNPIAWPSPAVLKRGQFQQDISDKSLALYESLWERLRMGE
jgi:spermidine/putrescine transport system substrate-binding protein